MVGGGAAVGMDNSKKDDEGLSLRAEAVAGAGRGALIVSMFGAGWLGWGLGLVGAFNVVSGSVFGFVALFLWVCSIYTIRKGRLLAKQYPSVPAAIRRAVIRSFLLIVLIEVLVIALGFLLANWIHHPELGVVWCAMVVGLHFVPLAKIFRAPTLRVFGILIAIWSAVCWALFRSNALVIATTTGTGILLWGTAVSSLLRARSMAQSLS